MLGLLISYLQHISFDRETYVFAVVEKLALPLDLEMRNLEKEPHWLNNLCTGRRWNKWYTNSMIVKHELQSLILHRLSMSLLAARNRET